jgi:hypothetical protein
LPNTTRSLEYGNKIGNIAKTNSFNTSLWLGYEWKENLFIDLTFLFRNYKVSSLPLLSQNTSLVSLGIRMNMARREYDY